MYNINNQALENDDTLLNQGHLHLNRLLPRVFRLPISHLFNQMTMVVPDAQDGNQPTYQVEPRINPLIFQVYLSIRLIFHNYLLLFNITNMLNIVPIEPVKKSHCKSAKQPISPSMGKSKTIICIMSISNFKFFEINNPLVLQ